MSVSRLALNTGKTPESKSGPVIKTSGAYVFNGNKVSASLNEEQTRGLLWIKNKMKNSIMVVYCPYDNMPVTLEIKGAKSSARSYLDGTTPSFQINVNVNANVTEQACSTDFNDKEKLNKLSQALETAIRKDIESTINASKNLRIDFIGLSRVLHRQHKEQWHQLSSKWNSIFVDAEVTVDVKVDINHVSLAKSLGPLKPRKK